MHGTTHQTRMKVSHIQLCTGRTATQCRHFDFLQFGLLQAFRFRPSILEPDLHLCFGESQRRREFGTLCDAQVLLLAEFLFEREQLLCGEWRSRLPVGLVFAQIAFDAGRFVVVCVQREREKKKKWISK